MNGGWGRVAPIRTGIGLIRVATCAALLTLAGGCSSATPPSPTAASRSPTTAIPSSSASEPATPGSSFARPSSPETQLPTGHGHGNPPQADVGFGRIREAQSGLLSAGASWNAPKALVVEQSQRIGLAIGDSPALTTKINQLLPNTTQTPAGTVSVGPDMTAQLRVDPNDADVTPSDSANASTPDNVQLLWTWIVRPKRPNKALVLTAHLEVPVAGGGTLPTDIGLQIPVDRTISYTAGQIFSHWATWSAIGAAAVGGVGWFLRRLKRKQESAHADDQPESAQPSHAGGAGSQAPPPDEGLRERSPHAGD
jgi:hypothetical protein